MENKTVTENSTVSCAEEMNTAEVYGSDQYAADLKTATRGEQPDLIGVAGLEQGRRDGKISLEPSDLERLKRGHHE